MMKTNVVRLLLLGLTFASTTGCVRRYAINKLGDALARSGEVYASDNDPESRIARITRIGRGIRTIRAIRGLTTSGMPFFSASGTQHVGHRVICFVAGIFE